MKRIIFIIICGILVIPSILGSFFDALPNSPKFLNPNNDSIINFIPTKIIHRYFCITSLSYIDTTFYSVEVQYTKNKKIGGFQGISVKNNGTRSFAFRCGFNDYGEKKYIKGDTIQVRYVESWIKKLNIDSLINNNYTIYSPIANLYGYWFGYFTIPLTTDTINKTMGYIDIHRSDSIEFCYFERDYLGSIRAVTDADGRLLQSVDYHVSGNPVVNVVSDRQATNRLHTGKEFQPFQGVALYDNQARYYDPIGSKFLTMDPLCEKYPSLSPYSHCANNPLSIIDPDGRDTINISYQNNKWNIESPIIAEGDDIFNVSINGEISTFTFSDSEYGNRVNMLNLEVGEEFNDITFGVYHISGAAQDGTGYYIAPGGNADNTYGSKKRIIDGAYPILKPHENAQWQKPGVGGSVSSRGIRFHYGINRKWTNGCFILSYDYNVGNYNIFDLNSSILASRNFDMFLGASSKFIHKTTTGKKREGSIFNNIIKHKLILKTR